MSKSKAKKELGLLFLFLLFMILFAIFGYKIAPHNPYEPNYDKLLSKPDSEYPMGTDDLGRCIYSRILYGGRITMSMALITVGVVASVGLFLGIVSGYKGGLFDSVLMRILDIFLAFPAQVFTIAYIAMAGTGMVNLMVALCIRAWPSYTRVSRDLTLNLKNSDMVKSAMMAGNSDFKIIINHIFTNIVPYVLPMITQDLGQKFTILSGFSLLGLGVQPPIPEWGSLIGAGRAFIQRAPWMILFPTLVVFVYVLVFNLSGDKINHIFNPKK